VVFQCGVMTFYLPNTDVIPTGFEPAEFIDPDPVDPQGRVPVPATREYVGAGITVHTAAITPDPQLEQQRTADTVAEGLATITPKANGPLSVKGPVGLTRPDGSTQVAERLLLCRCGHSASKPNCDGSHIRVGFTASGVSSERPST
jgi:CDGSH-type Zn-finger protein